MFKRGFSLFTEIDQRDKGTTPVMSIEQNTGKQIVPKELRNLIFDLKFKDGGA